MTNINPLLAEQRFKLFQESFPTIEARYRVAVQLAELDSDDVKLMPDSYISRNFLAANWAEKPDELFGIAYMLYDMSDKLKYFPHEQVLVFKEGTYQDVMTDIPYLSTDIKLTFGSLEDDHIAIGFQGNNTHHKGPLRMGLPPPFLGFGTLLKIRHANEIKIDMPGISKVEPAKSPSEEIPFFLGTVSLEYDEAKYQKTKRLIRRQVIVGESLCQRVLGKLEEKSTFRKTHLNN